MEKIANYIGGRWQAPLQGQYRENYQPATGKVYSGRGL
jgi:acyl-CoA reductase-like NAD-dependent aldehyde dehydrogenase